MSYDSMASELEGSVPKLSKTLAFVYIQRAFDKIRKTGQLWSFQLAECSWYSPSLLSTGTLTATLGTNQVTLDANASAAVLALGFPLPTQYQLKTSGQAIYSIVAMDATAPAAVVLTLDRNYTDVGAVGAGLSYQMYQAYYPVPYKDFRKWISVRDMTTNRWLCLTKTRRQADMEDPRRTYGSIPNCIIPYATDTRTGSSTAGFMLYELFPNPVSPLSYQGYYVREGADLVNPSDTLPDAISESCVIARAKMLAYEYAEVNRDPDSARGSGADYKFAFGMAKNDYETDLKDLRKKDRDRIELFKSTLLRQGCTAASGFPYFYSQTNRAYSGG